MQLVQVMCMKFQGMNDMYSEHNGQKKLIWHCNKRIGDLILHSATNLQKYPTEELANTNGPYPTYEFSTEHPTYVVFTYMCLFVLTSSDCMSR